jgi:hypothetical protein
MMKQKTRVLVLSYDQKRNEAYMYSPTRSSPSWGNVSLAGKLVPQGASKDRAMRTIEMLSRCYRDAIEMLSRCYRDMKVYIGS